MRIYEREGSFDLAHPNEKQYQVVIQGLPDEAPSNCLSVLFDEEQGIDDLPPSEVVEFMLERIESFWVSTSRKGKRETIDWIRENAERVDSMWAKDQIERLRDSIRRKQDKMYQLECDYLEE